MADAVHLRIAGRVQGVGYRAWLEREAVSNGLRGWVRNRRDGSVEGVLIGGSEAIEKVIAACRRGPRLAKVTDVRTSPSVDDKSIGFRQLSTT
jgi:acylphosphatase